jgi:O-antigen/teichoic acid export membrane protein
VNSAFNIALSVLIGVMLSGLTEGLVLGFAAGLVASAAYMFWVQRRIWDAEGFGSRLPALSSLWGTAGKYRHLPTQVLPFTILTVVIHSAAPLVLNANYGLSEIGLYAVASRALLAPSSIVAAAIGEPFRAELAARTRNKIEIVSITHKLLLFLVTFSAVAFLSIYAIAPLLFEWLFGVGFARSGEIARVLCLGAFTQFIILPVNQVFVITDRMREGLIAQSMVALIPTLTLLLTSHSRSLEAALFAWSVAMLVTGLIMVFLVHRAAVLARPLSETGRQ